VGKGTGDGKDRKQDRIGDDETTKREHLAQVIGQWDYDDLTDKIGGRYPAAVVDTRSDASLDVQQRSIGDLDVEDRHEGADHARQYGDPGRRTCLVRPRDWRAAHRSSEGCGLRSI